jgi:hypothetical protein
MSEKITVDTILSIMKEKVENKEAQFDTEFWLSSAAKLNLLVGDEQDKLFELQQVVAKLKLQWFESQEKRNVSEAKLRVEATEEYKEMRKLEAKIKRCEEFVRIAKKMADVASGF